MASVKRVAVAAAGAVVVVALVLLLCCIAASSASEHLSVNQRKGNFSIMILITRVRRQQLHFIVAVTAFLALLFLHFCG